MKKQKYEKPTIKKEKTKNFPIEIIDASGNKVWDSQLEITGSDFQDVMGFSIRAQDVGTAIGVGLKGLIYNKMEAFYGVSFQ